MTTQTSTAALALGDIVQVNEEHAGNMNVPAGTRAVVKRVDQSGPHLLLYVDVRWQDSHRFVMDEGWNADRFTKVASLHPAGTIVYLTKNSEDGKNGIEAYRDEQWPLRGVVETAPAPFASDLMARGYTVRLDDGNLVYATQRMIESAFNTVEELKTMSGTTIPVPAPEPDPEIERLSAEVRRLQDQVSRMNQWKDDLVRDAHEYADNNSLCSEFDRFMTEHDLPAREADYEVEVTFTVRATLTVRAQDEDNALEQAESEALSLRSDIDYHIERNMDLTGVDTDFDQTGDAERQ